MKRRFCWSSEARYDFSISQMSRMIFSNRLLDNDFIEYSCVESLAFLLLLNASIIRFLVHFLNEKPGDKTYCSGEYQNSLPVESTTCIVVLFSIGKEEMQLFANCLILNAE